MVMFAPRPKSKFDGPPLVKTCSCGAKIQFIKHCRSDKMLPCEVDKTTIIKPTGEMVQGFQPHWVSCPDADKWRNRKKRD